MLLEAQLLPERGIVSSVMRSHDCVETRRVATPGLERGKFYHGQII
jgi:hypothetical protein